MTDICAQTDDLVRRPIRWLLWGVPAVLFVLGAFVAPLLRLLLWTPAFLMAGVACLMNARRCGRLHCYITGPLYLLAALTTVLVGMSVLSLPSRWIAWGAIGGTILAHAPEWVRGRYVPQASRRSV